eukprot:711042-Alexandrium_andersonii.AAC.1
MCVCVRYRCRSSVVGIVGAVGVVVAVGVAGDVAVYVDVVVDVAVVGAAIVLVITIDRACARAS